jgi:hypothetical protein
MTFGITTHGITTLSIMSLRIKTLSNMTLSITTVSMHNNSQHNNAQKMTFSIMIQSITHSAITLSRITIFRLSAEHKFSDLMYCCLTLPSIVMLSGIMVNVTAPKMLKHNFIYFCHFFQSGANVVKLFTSVIYKCS